MLEKNKCPFCESKNVTLVSSDEFSHLPDGTNFKFKASRLTCADCGTVSDVNNSSDEAFTAAYEVAKQHSLENICAHLSEGGLSMAAIERSFSLPQRTIGRWKSQGCSASAMALMNLLHTLPFLAKIADHQYDRGYAAQEILNFAGSLIRTTASNVNIDAEIRILTGENSLSLRADFRKKEPKRDQNIVAIALQSGGQPLTA